MSSIGTYIQKRAKTHHQLYQYQRQPNDMFGMTMIDETIFYVLYFAVNQSLGQGHTTICLNHHWQTTLMALMMDYIYDELEFRFDFQGVFTRIDELSHDAVALKDYIYQAIDNLKNDHQKHEMLNHIKNKRNDAQREQFIQKISIMILHLFRFYYYVNHKTDGSLSSLTALLSRHCFFGHKDNHQDRPIIYHHQIEQGVLYLWLNRIYHAEVALLSGLYRAYRTPTDEIAIHALNPQLNHEQQQAVHAITHHAISIITGGPGTGKTFTIAQAVMALLAQNALKLALVAPTGKASQRMKESLQKALSGTYVDLPEPMTIHRLLGIGLDGLARYDRHRPLPFDLIIVDEASMMGVELANQMINALKQGSRLVLLGDTHQLFAVEAGSVLSDLCDLPLMKNHRVHLIESRRFHKNSGIGKLAQLINQPHHQSYEQLIHLICQYQDLSYHDTQYFYEKNIHEFYDNLSKDYSDDTLSDSYFTLTKKTKHQFYQLNDEAKKDQLKTLHDKFNEYQILCASHLSLWGDEKINQHIQKSHQQYLKIPPKIAQYSDWYHGRPVMVLKNRYDLGLFNGDIGICLQYGKKANELAVFFYGETIKSFPISMLTGDMISTAYAMTIHKSQGSEFDKVAVVFHDENERLLSKELLYTAITRAKQSVSIYATPSALSKAVNQPTIRQTGLALHKPIG